MVRGSSPSSVSDPLGPLSELPGTWVGKGFNLIALPTFDKSTRKFRLKLNATIETLTFTSIGGPVPNRGNDEDDINIFGVTYLQSVADANGQGALHVEPGIWLNVPPSHDQPLPNPNSTVVRLATIPHGDSVMAPGTWLETATPIISPIDSTPFTLDATGNRVNDTSPAYLAQYSDPTLLPPGITTDVVANPNQLLSAAIQDQKIVDTIVMFVSANPVGGIDISPSGPSVPPGDIANIPFVVKNANANSMAAIFWIETVENPDGTQFLQLQYTQTVILDFPVPGPDGKPVAIKWPHISVATLIKH